MKKCLMMFLMMIVASVLVAQNPQFIKVRDVDGRKVVTHDVKVIQNNDNTAIIHNLATDQSYLIMRTATGYYRIEPTLASLKGPLMNPVPEGLGVSCMCPCGCCFSQRLVSWNCVTCPACAVKLWWNGCIWTCGDNMCCTVFEIPEE